MLENVDMYKIKIHEEYGAFRGNTMLFSFQVRILLTHFVRLSQEQGKWVTELTLRGFLTDFPMNMYFVGPSDFCYWMCKAKVRGYLTIEPRDGPGNDILRVTKRFAKLCKKECE